MAEITDINTLRIAKEQKALQGQDYQVVHCLKIPLGNGSAILPNAAVAEVIAYTKPEQVEDGPSWLLGYLQWRDHKVAFMSLEAITGEQNFAREGPRIAILNTFNMNPKVPYIAVLMQGIPGLMVVKPDTAEWDETKLSGDNRSVMGFININGEVSFVPNIDNLEERIQKLHV